MCLHAYLAVIGIKSTSTLIYFESLEMESEYWKSRGNETSLTKDIAR